MKGTVSLLLLVSLFYGCGSSKSSLLHKDPAFRPTDLLSTNITLYQPQSVYINSNKYSGYSIEEVKTEIANMVKEKIVKVSYKENVTINNQKIPGFYDGVLLDKAAAIQFIKKAPTKYIVLIEQVLVGKGNKTIKMPNSTTNKSFTYNQDITKVTMYFDVWNTEKAVSVFSIEASADLNDVLNMKGLYMSCGKAIDEFIACIK